MTGSDKLQICRLREKKATHLLPLSESISENVDCDCHSDVHIHAVPDSMLFEGLDLRPVAAVIGG